MLAAQRSDFYTTLTKEQDEMKKQAKEDEEDKDEWDKFWDELGEDVMKGAKGLSKMVVLMLIVFLRNPLRKHIWWRWDSSHSKFVRSHICTHARSPKPRNDQHELGTHSLKQSRSCVTYLLLSSF